MGQFDNVRAQIDAQRSQRTQNFNNTFWQSTGEYVAKNKGTWDLANKSINFPTKVLPSKDALWNKYLEFAKAKGVKADYMQFNTNYAGLKTAENNQYLKLIQDSKLLGIKDKDIRKQLQNNPEQLLKLNSILQTTDAETAAELLPLLEKQQSIGDFYGDKWSNVKSGDVYNRHPILAPAVTAAGAYGVYKYGKGKLSSYLANKNVVPPKTKKAPIWKFNEGTTKLLTEGKSKGSKNIIKNVKRLLTAGKTKDAVKLLTSGGKNNLKLLLPHLKKIPRIGPAINSLMLLSMANDLTKD